MTAVTVARVLHYSLPRILYLRRKTGTFGILRDSGIVFRINQGFKTRESMILLAVVPRQNVKGGNVSLT